MEPILFPFEGKQFIHTPGSLTTRDLIEVVLPNDSNRYFYELTKVKEIDKIEARIIIRYRKWIFPVDVVPFVGEAIYDNANLEFNATTQQTIGYFYAMINTNISLGKSLDQMLVDGLLIHLFGMQQGVYGSDGEFYFPFSVSHVITTNTVTVPVLDAEGEPVLDGEGQPLTTEEVTSRDLLLIVSDPLPEEEYTYTVLNSALPVQTNGEFLDIAPGTYYILVESPRSMGYLAVVNL